MPKLNSIKPSELDSSNRKLLTAARKVGLSSDEIIRKSLQAAYGKLLKRAAGLGKPAAAGKNHNHNQNHAGPNPARKQTGLPPRTKVDGDHGGQANLRKPRR